jgi:predicted MarR family transcription regulator
MPAFGTDRITSLADIAMFTESDDVPLMKVLASMRDLENGKEASIACQERKEDIKTFVTKQVTEQETVCAVGIAVTASFHIWREFQAEHLLPPKQEKK